MKPHGRVDNRQSEIVRALRQLGASVQSLASVGGGCPDLLVGYHGLTLALEVKADKGKLTPEQMIWHREWTGHVRIVRTIAEAVAALNEAVRRGMKGAGQ